jgi:chemotaxis protein MotB
MRRAWLLVALSALGCGSKTRYPDGSGAVGQLNREIVALHQKLRLAERAAEQCVAPTAATDPLYQELHQLLRTTEVSVRRDGRSTVVVIPGGHLFGVDEVSLRQEAAMTLDLIATALTRHPRYWIDVEGHTDELGVPSGARSRFDNPQLFTAVRAYALTRYLIDQGVDANRIAISGRSSTRPAASNDSEPGRRANRRIELHLHPM